MSLFKGRRVQIFLSIWVAVNCSITAHVVYLLTHLLYMQVHTHTHRPTVSLARCLRHEVNSVILTHMCRRPARVLRGQTDSLWNHHKSEQCTAGSPAFSLCRGLSCHPPYRSVYCNVKYHCTLEDIVWRFCQGSLEYFVLIARAAAGRKWLPCEFLTACFFFSLVWKNNLI